MKYALCIATALLLMSCGGKKTELKTDKDSVSYSIGLDIGTTFHRQGIEVENEAFLQGMKDAADTSAEKLMTEEQIRAVMTAYQQKMIAKAKEKLREQSAPERERGEKFLAENRTKPGVITTASGLQYKVIKMGKGKKPTMESEVRLHYRGKLVDGTEFDNSFSRGEPMKLPVGGVMAGWTEALQMMPVGSKWELFVPTELGFAEKGSGPIPPGAALIFELELLAIVQ